MIGSFFAPGSTSRLFLGELSLAPTDRFRNRQIP